ncbi:MAG TPA: FtsX-like permease family protein [Micromonosporaceae bacterium]
MLRATFKNLLARKIRLTLSGLAVVLGVMFVSGSFVLTDTLSRSFDALFRDAYATTDVQVSAEPKIKVSESEAEQPTPPLPAPLVETVRRIPGVAEAHGTVLADGARVIGANGKVLTSFGPPQLGGNWLGENELIELREGRGPIDDHEIAVNAYVAEAAGLKIGDRVGVLSLHRPKREFTLVGIWGYSGGRDSLGGAQEVAFTETAAQELMLGEHDVFTSITVEAADGVDPTDLRDTIAARLGDGFMVKTGEQLSTESADAFEEGLSFVNRILLGFAAVALFVGTFLIINTFSIVVAQRTRELALLRAIGANRRQVITSVLTEAAVIGLIAATLGTGAGIGVGTLLAHLFTRFAEGLELAGINVPPTAVISAFAVGLPVTVIAAALPALRASRIPPVAAMQDIATPDRPLTAITLTGAAITTAGSGLLTLGLSGRAGDQALWAVLGGILLAFIGVALLTPIISRPVVSLLGRIFSWSLPGRLGRLNSGRNPRRTAITAAALMVGIALVTGVSVVLDSAKSSFAARTADTIQAQLVISGTQTGPRPPSFDPAVLDRAAELPEMRAVAGIYHDLALIDGRREAVTATNDPAALAAIYQPTVTAGTLDQLGTEQMAVSTQAAAKRGLSVGETVSVQLSRGEARGYRIVALYPQEELPGDFLLPAAAAADFAIPQPVLAFLQIAPGTDVDRVRPKVEALLTDNPEVSVADRTTFIEQQAAQFDNLLTMIRVLLALAIVIAVLGIVNTLALSVLERTRELGMLRAIGLGRAQTMWMITVEAMVISVFGALLGVTVGTGLGSATVHALRDEGIDNLVLPWSEMALYLGLAAVIGIIAAALPAIRAARLNVLGAIAHE